MFQPPLPLGGGGGLQLIQCHGHNGRWGMTDSASNSTRKGQSHRDTFAKATWETEGSGHGGGWAPVKRAPLCLAPGVQPPLEHPGVPVLTSQ